MARKTVPLTNTQVKQAKPSEKVRKFFDGDGLQLLVKPNGSKLWVLDYTHPITGKRSSISFGPYSALSLADARKKRAAARELIVSGLDPKEHKEDLLREKQLAASYTLQSPPFLKANIMCCSHQACASHTKIIRCAHKSIHFVNRA